MRKLFATFLLLCIAPVYGSETCDVSKDPKYSDFPPLRDKDYSPQAAARAAKKLQDYFEARAVGTPYRELPMSSNYILIINGADLLDTVRIQKEILRKAKKEKTQVFITNADLEKTINKYCDYRKSNSISDW